MMKIEKLMKPEVTPSRDHQHPRRNQQQLCRRQTATRRIKRKTKHSKVDRNLKKSRSHQQKQIKKRGRISNLKEDISLRNRMTVHQSMKKQASLSKIPNRMANKHSKKKEQTNTRKILNKTAIKSRIKKETHLQRLPSRTAITPTNSNKTAKLKRENSTRPPRALRTLKTRRK